MSEVFSDVLHPKQSSSSPPAWFNAIQRKFKTLVEQSDGINLDNETPLLHLISLVAHHAVMHFSEYQGEGRISVLGFVVKYSKCRCRLNSTEASTVG